ncbi:DUF3515 domain-containing protein [Nocardiopsis mangrovi]|uniref:DUF3515 domain-containing protein n=1 Tax=Nocardiopsis mangrovi TaxID=1179818 RepID=A0ABV9DN08_9ACTN
MRRVAVGATVAGLALVSGCSGTVEVPVPDPQGAAAEQCRALVEGAPDELFGEARATVEPESPYTAAWGDPPIALRCGVERPAGLLPDSELMVVDDIAWLPQPPDRPTLYTAVGREAYVEMTVPPSYGPPAEALVAVSALIADGVPALPGGEL